MASRIWKIRESYGDRMNDRYGNKSAEEFETPEEKEAYECGYEEGYQAAMEEAQMGERSYGMGQRHYMGERRGRDSMGRFR